MSEWESHVLGHSLQQEEAEVHTLGEDLRQQQEREDFRKLQQRYGFVEQCTVRALSGRDHCCPYHQYLE